jgi:hypothetical protein
MSLVMSETSQRSSVDNVNEVLKTFISVSFSEPSCEFRQQLASVAGSQALQ